jgi:alkylation response protein AidB-like acyl-CoA dehydrogenase
MVGAADAALSMTRDYAINRKQFGRQIGFFQAVKHPLVDIMVGVELARNHVLGAASALDHAPADAEIAARMAKSLSSDVFALAVRKGVQLHGGYGFTIDCDMHLYFKRALWSRATLGDGPLHRRHLAAALVDANAAGAEAS